MCFESVEGSPLSCLALVQGFVQWSDIFHPALGLQKVHDAREDCFITYIVQKSFSGPTFWCLLVPGRMCWMHGITDLFYSRILIFKCCLPFWNPIALNCLTTVAPFYLQICFSACAFLGFVQSSPIGDWGLNPFFQSYNACKDSHRLDSKKYCHVQGKNMDDWQKPNGFKADIEVFCCYFNCSAFLIEPGRKVMYLLLCTICTRKAWFQNSETYQIGIVRSSVSLSSYSLLAMISAGRASQGMQSPEKWSEDMSKRFL